MKKILAVLPTLLAIIIIIHTLQTSPFLGPTTEEILIEYGYEKVDNDDYHLGFDEYPADIYVHIDPEGSQTSIDVLYEIDNIQSLRMFYTHDTNHWEAEYTNSKGGVVLEPGDACAYLKSVAPKVIAELVVLLEEFELSTEFIDSGSIETMEIILSNDLEFMNIETNEIAYNYSEDIPTYVATSKDSDGDGLDNETEETMGTDPLNPDTDGGGTSDYDEINGGNNNKDSCATNPVNNPKDDMKIIEISVDMVNNSSKNVEYNPLSLYLCYENEGNTFCNLVQTTQIGGSTASTYSVTGNTSIPQNIEAYYINAGGPAIGSSSPTCLGFN